MRTCGVWCTRTNRRLAGIKGWDVKLYPAKSVFFVTQINVLSEAVVKEDCPCPENCLRHGYCDECVEFHGAKGKLPYCERPKFSITGSVKKFLGIK